MQRGVTGIRALIAVFAVVAVSGCVGPPKPSLNKLAGDHTPRFVSSVAIEFVSQPKTPLLMTRLQNAFADWPAEESPAGRPVKLTIVVKRYIHVDAVQALLVGGASNIQYSVRIEDEADSTVLYQIDRVEQVGYAPGGIIGVVAVLSTDEEDALSKELAKSVLTMDLRSYNISIARGAISGFPKRAPPAKQPSS